MPELALSIGIKVQTYCPKESQSDVDDANYPYKTFFKCSLCPFWGEEKVVIIL